MNCQTCKYYWDSCCHNKDFILQRKVNIEEIDTDIGVFLEENDYTSIIRSIIYSLTASDNLKKTKKIANETFKEMENDLLDYMIDTMLMFQKEIEGMISAELSSDNLIQTPETFYCSYWQ